MIQASDEGTYNVTVPDEQIVDADEDTAFVISCSYTGLVGAAPDMLEGEPADEYYDMDENLVSSHGRLQFDAYDRTGKEMNIAYSWEAKETEGIAVTEDGKVSFTLPGTYHIRVKSGDQTSNWFVINAANTSEEYSVVWFIEDDGTHIKDFNKPWGSELTAPEVPERKGYVFDGWDNEVPSAMPADNMTFTAKWIPVEDETQNIASDEEFLNWVKTDYEKRTSVKAEAEYTSKKAGEYVIAVKDKDGNLLDTYAFDPKTGTGFSDAGEVDLPQTGMSGAHKAVAGLAALMGITGIGLVKRSRKEDE